ncbi:MAG: HAD family phosphatase [Cytophagales bacterium]|nr:HAD family phosphatase [Cytophagales bacterium]
MQFPKGILFDFDGTLVDSETFHFRSARDLFKRDFNVEIDMEYYNQKMAGIPLSKSSPDFIKELNLPTTPEEVTNAFDVHTSEMLEKEAVPLMPHALEAIDFFEERGCLLGIVTGSGRRDVSLTLRRLNLYDRFQVLVSHNEVENVKPHAEPYLKGVAGLGLQKEEIVAFEDSPNGMTSALNAGLTCIGIQREPVLSNRMNRGTMLVKGFDQVIQHFRQL